MVFLKLSFGAAWDLDALCTKSASEKASHIQAVMVAHELERLYNIFGVALLPTVDAAKARTAHGDEGDPSNAPYEDQLKLFLTGDDDLHTKLKKQWTSEFLLSTLRRGGATHNNEGVLFIRTHGIGFTHLLVVNFHAVKARRRGNHAPLPRATLNMTARIPPHLAEFASARQSLAFPEDGDVLLRVALSGAIETPQEGLVELLSSCSGDQCSRPEVLDAFLSQRESASRTSGEESWGTLTICPRRSPPPSLAQLRKNARVAMIENACDMRAYNHMMRQSSPENSGASHAKRAGANYIVPSAASGSGKPLRVDPTLAKLGLDKADIANIASVVYQPIDHRKGAVTAPGRNRSGALGSASESYSSFMKDLTIGIDMRLMSLAGAVVGYYVCYSRGQSVDTCLVGAAVGAVAMLMVDAVLLMIRLSKEDGHLKQTLSSALPTDDDARPTILGSAASDSALSLASKKRQ